MYFVVNFDGEMYKTVAHLPFCSLKPSLFPSPGDTDTKDENKKKLYPHQSGKRTDL